MLTKIKNADFDVLFIPGYYTEAGLIIKQAREWESISQLLVRMALVMKKWSKQQARKMYRMFIIQDTSTKAPANDKVEPFVEAFKAKYSKEPSAFNALAYDAVYMIKQAIEDQDSADSTAIAEGLSALKNFQGVTGDHHGQKS